MKNLKKIKDTFIEKPCTILTNKASIDLDIQKDYQKFLDLFFGIVEDVNEDGVFLRHDLTKCKSFFNWTSIVGIVEEQVIYEDDPRYNKIKEEIQASSKANEKNPTPFAPMDLNKHIDINQLNDMLQKSKNDH
jgi:hypothetical protein